MYTSKEINGNNINCRMLQLNTEHLQHANKGRQMQRQLRHRSRNDSTNGSTRWQHDDVDLQETIYFFYHEQAEFNVQTFQIIS
jgi:hypothetical protein